MHIYIAIKSIVMAIALVAGVSLFFIKLNRLVPLMQVVQGKVVFKPDWIFDRLKILFTDILTILGFLIYIPGSKHLHLLAAAPNVFLKPRQRPKAMITTDMEDEEAESFGLGKVCELTWKLVLDLYACTECGRCEEQCPADSGSRT